MSLATMMQWDASMSALKEGAVNVDFDATLLVEMVVFTVLCIVLKPILFDPMLKLFAEREKRIDDRIGKLVSAIGELVRRPLAGD